MDPASATVAFVGFAASIATLCGLVIESSRTLYELQDKVRSAPDELRKLYSTLKSLENLLLEIQRRSADLDNLNVSLELRESWSATLSLLEAAMVSLQEWLTLKFGSLDLEPLGRKGFRQRLTFFFADKKLGALHRSIDENIHRLGLLQGLIISSQCQHLEAQYLVFPRLISRVQDEVTLGTSRGLQMIQRLRGDVFELHQTQLAAIKTLYHSRSDHEEHSRSDQARRNTRRFWGRIARSSDPSSLLPGNRCRSSIFAEEQLFNVICSLPIGLLYYSRGYKKSISTKNDSRITETVGEQSTVAFKFAPASWISNVLVQLTIEMCRGEDQTRTLSIRLKDPPRICTDKEVIESLGLKNHTMDPAAFQRFILQGRVRPNDVLFSYQLNEFVSILEAVLANLRHQPGMAYQICETLLSNGARIDVMSSDHGTPFYIASGGNLEVFGTVCHETQSSCISLPSRKAVLDECKLKEIKSVQNLLLRHNAAFDIHLPYGSQVKAWSGEHGWLSRFMSLSHDPEYLRQVLFDNLGLFEIEDFGQCDRWLIAILCQTFPILRAAMEKQAVLATGSRLPSFTSDLELATVIKQVKAASPRDRCLLIGSICRHGTVEMLLPFLQGDFDLDERPERAWWLAHDSGRYICQAAKFTRFDIMNALVGAGVRIENFGDLVDIFTDAWIGKLCRKCDTIPLIDLVFATFDFEACPERTEILRTFFQGCHGLSNRFEDSWLALGYISAGLIRRGCFLARPPISLDHILIAELFETIRTAWCDLDWKNWILHVINEYQTNLELTAVTFSSFEKGLSFNVTALGLSLELDKLEITQVLLDAGANIHDPIVGGRSALEIAKENLQKAPRVTYLISLPMREKEAFGMIIDALKSRGLDSIADEAILEVQECLPRTNLQKYGAAKRFRILLDSFLAQVPLLGKKLFYRVTAKQIITAITLDGIFIRMSFLFSICFILCFEVWRSLKESILGRRPPAFVLRLVAVALLRLVFALKFQYGESRPYTVL